MSKATIKVKYDGSILSNHRMDIADLAPALIGLSDLCKIANRKFNGDRASVKVLISTDIEHQCFQFSLDIVQTYWEITKGLLANDDVSSAAELAAWLGIFAYGLHKTRYLGLLSLLKWIKGRPIESTEFLSEEGQDLVRLTIDGTKVVAYLEAYKLLEEKSALANAKKVVAPVAKDGYDYVEFDGENGVAEKITKEDADNIMAIDFESTVEGRLEREIITQWIKVYSPVYDTSVTKWRFFYGDAHPYMDISETNIAAQAIERGGALINDAYKVRLELQQVEGDSTINYKVKEVLEFRPAPPPLIQSNLTLDENSQASQKER